MTWFSCCFSEKVAPPKLQTIVFDEEFSRVHNIELYTYRELSAATENFSRAARVGQGGFGSVYKGILNNGTTVAIKVLSDGSRQGVKEFMAELVSISNINHENLVTLTGCCVEDGYRILVYGYLENHSLDQTLLDEGDFSIKFDWERRKQICFGVAKGLAFLHEDVQPRIVHRDIKASNILLDKDFTPKISDFGLAKLFPDNQTHIRERKLCRLRGITPEERKLCRLRKTLGRGVHIRGYLAPEYALHGQLTRKADVYSFGVLLLEIVSGRCNTNKHLPVGEQNLLEKAWKMYESGNLARLVDTSLEADTNIEEPCKFLKIALLCTQEMPKLRPRMSEVVQMMKDEFNIDEKEISKPGFISNLGEIKTQKGSTYTSSSSDNKTQRISSTFANSDTSCGTMTFTSIYDRDS